MNKTFSLGMVLLVSVASALAQTTNFPTTNGPGRLQRPTTPARAPDAPGTPRLTPVGGPAGETNVLRGAPGMNPPVDAEGDFLIGPDYVTPPEFAVKEGVPQGKVEQFVMDSVDSKFYPGIAKDAPGRVDPNNPRTLILETRPQSYRRTITVYIPSQYQSGAVAPFMVSHDGPALGRPDLNYAHLLDNLIAQKRIPAVIAVMVSNGGGDAQGSQRGLEYDTMSGKLAEFIEAEVLPLVEKNYGVTLTKDPEGRVAMGNSSGGAAALAMAWYHTDWYHRVITYSGTYVNQQWPFNPETPGGAWDFHEKLIPQSDRKPIRIWMQVGDRDLLNPNVMRDGMHDWVEANNRMAKVLKTKGYHYQYVYSLNAGHVDRKAREQTLPQALEWVWRGYPIK